jgi:tellurite resistance protein
MFLSILNNEEKEDFLNLIINVAEIDGDFSEKEKNQIGAYVLEMGLSLKEKNEYNKSNESLLNTLSQSSNEVKKAIFVEVIALMLVDGMKDEEKVILEKMQNKFEFDESFKEKAINWYSEILPLYKKGFELVGIGGVL